jgi:hypothetical protein
MDGMLGRDPERVKVADSGALRVKILTGTLLKTAYEVAEDVTREGPM